MKVYVRLDPGVIVRNIITRCGTLGPAVLDVYDVLLTFVEEGRRIVETTSKFRRDMARLSEATKGVRRKIADEMSDEDIEVALRFASSEPRYLGRALNSRRQTVGSFGHLLHVTERDGVGQLNPVRLVLGNTGHLGEKLLEYAGGVHRCCQIRVGYRRFSSHTLRYRILYFREIHPEVLRGATRSWEDLWYAPYLGGRLLNVLRESCVDFGQVYSVLLYWGAPKPADAMLEEMLDIAHVLTCDVGQLLWNACVLIGVVDSKPGLLRELIVSSLCWPAECVWLALVGARLARLEDLPRSKVLSGGGWARGLRRRFAQQRIAFAIGRRLWR